MEPEPKIALFTDEDNVIDRVRDEPCVVIFPFVHGNIGSMLKPYDAHVTCIRWDGMYAMTKKNNVLISAGPIRLQNVLAYILREIDYGPRGRNNARLLLGSTRWCEDMARMVAEMVVQT